VSSLFYMISVIQVSHIKMLNEYRNLKKTSAVINFIKTKIIDLLQC